MKLGNGKKKYKIKFAYKVTNKVAIKYVYANDRDEAIELFFKCYENFDIRILDIFEVK